MKGPSRIQLDGEGALPTIDNDTIAVFQRNLPGNSSAAISIIGHVGGESILKLGDTDDEDIGRIRYQHADNSMDFFTNNAQGMTIDAVGNVSTSGQLHVVGDAAYSKFELDGAGALPAIDNDTIALFQRNQPGNSTAAITILAHAGGESILKLGDTNDEDIGRIRYMHADNSMDFLTNNALAMSVDAVGNVTASGNISASAYVRAPFVHIGNITPGGMRLGESTAGVMKFGDGAQFSATLTNLTASGNISGSATSTLTIGGQATFGTSTVVIDGAAGHITASGNISASGTIYADNFESANGDDAGINFNDNMKLTGNLTSSGRISASEIRTDFVYLGDQTAGGVKIGESSPGIIKLGHGAENSLTLTNLTASGEISTPSFANVNTTNVTASNNISASGNVIANKVATNTITDYAGTNIITDDGATIGIENRSFTTELHISASGNISSSGNIIGAELFSDSEVSLAGVRTLYRVPGSTNDFIGAVDGTTTLQGTTVKIAGNVTASNNISASGDLHVVSITATGVVSGSVEGFIGDLTGTASYVSQTEFFATDIVIGEDDETKIDFGTPNEIRFEANNALEMIVQTNVVAPGADDGTALGDANQRWSDLFLAEGAVINFDNGDVTITQTANHLAVAGTEAVSFVGNVTASGNISSSGEVIASRAIFDSRIYFGSLAAASSFISIGGNQDFVLNNGGLATTSNITASIFSGSEVVADLTGTASYADTIKGGTLQGTRLFVGNGSNVATAVVLSGDATMNNAGAVTLEAAQTNVTSLLAADLVVGDSTNNKFNFGTTNEIHFDIGGGAGLFKATAAAFVPGTTLEADLGTSALRFGKIIGHHVTASGNVSASGIITPTISATDANAGITITSNVSMSTAISSSATALSFISTLSNKRPQEDITNSGGAVSNTLLHNPDSDPSNKVLSVAAATDSNNVIMTLPAPEAGLSYTFLSSAVPGACTVDIKAGGTNLLFGIAICDDGTEDITGTTFRFANEKFLRGTRVECLSDGLAWSIQAYCLCDLADVSTS